MDLEKLFFDRKNTLAILKKRVIDLKDGYRQNVALLGPQHIGKTSILHKFVSDLDDPELITIYLDLDQKDFKYIFCNFVGSILYNFAKSKQLALHDDLSLLMETTKKEIPQTIEVIKRIQSNIDKKRFAESYRQLISLPEVFSLESKMFCLIILDEFHNLEDLAITDVFQELGKRIMTQKRCLYLMASSMQNIARKILSEKLSLLFGHFEIVDIRPFELETSQSFIGYCLSDIQMSRDLKNFLIDLTGGHPFYLSILVREIKNLSLIHNQSEVFLPLLSKAIENTIFDKWGVLSRHFEIMISQLSPGKNNREVCSLLIALANHHHKTEDIAANADLRKSFILQKMSILIEFGIVEKCASFYYLKDKLFKYWIKYIFQKRLNSIGCDLDRQRQHFSVELSESVSSFQSVSQKELSLRIVDLLKCFDNESFNFEGRRYRLPCFYKIKPLKMRSASKRDLDVIKAYSSDEAWFIVLNEEPLSEGDVSAFLSESKKLSQKPRRRVIISFKDLENSARLKALQEKTWIWSEGEINLLLNMYDKPYIVK